MSIATTRDEIKSIVDRALVDISRVESKGDFPVGYDTVIAELSNTIQDARSDFEGYTLDSLILEEE